MTLFSKLAILGFAVGAAFSSNAMADSHSDASVKITGFQLIDLDQQDGIAADISFFNATNIATSGVGSGQYGQTNGDYIGVLGSNPISATASMPGISGSADNAGGAFGNLTAHGDIAADGNFNMAAYFRTKFTITPKTVLVLFGDVAAHRIDGAQAGVQEGVTTSTSVSLSGPLNASGAGSQTSGFQRYDYNANSADHGNYAHSFALTFSNLDSRALDGAFASSVAVYGYAIGHSAPLPPVPDIPTSPVPEPETYAMMLAGLGLLGFMARRKKAVKLA